LRGCRSEAFAEVRDAFKPPHQFFVLCLDLVSTELGKGIFQGFLLGAEFADPFRDQFRLDPILQSDYLGLDLAFKLGYLLADTGPGQLAIAPLASRLGPQLSRSTTASSANRSLTKTGSLAASTLRER